MILSEKKRFVMRELGLAAIFALMSLVVFVRTHDLGRSVILFAEVFALLQPALLIAYLVDKKSGKE